MSGLNRCTLPNMDTNLKDSSSNSNNRKLTPDTPGSVTTISSSIDKLQTQGTGSHKKRKVPTTITTNACVNCKKARTKCDGNTPCGRCISGKNRFQEECTYEPHTKNAKEVLVRELKELRDMKRKAENIFESIAKSEHEQEIIQRIKNRDSIITIAQWLRSMNGDCESQQSAYGGSDNEVCGTLAEKFSWTTVISEPQVTNHLIALYFTWVHPFHPLFNEGHFVNSMDTGSTKFCSRSLYNSICAMACYLNSPLEEDTVDYRELGDQFCDLVMSTIDPEDKTLTTIQAFGVMFLVRCAQGQGLSGSVYLAVASKSMESLRPSDNDDVDYRQIWRETVRGINSLNVEWAQMTFKMAPAFVPELQPAQIAEELARWENEVDNLSWKSYHVPMDFTGEPQFACLTATTNREKMKLVEIIHDMTKLLYNTHGPQIHAKDLLALYRRLLAWRANLPERIARTGRKDVQMLPHVLSLHILYATTAVHLLHPLLDLGDSLVDSLVWQHVQDGLNLIDDRYRFQYSCRHQPVSQSFAILHLTEVLNQYFPQVDKEFGKDGAASINLATDILSVAHSGFPVTEVIMAMLQETARKLLRPLPNELEKLFRRQPKKSNFYLDDAINACGWPTYAQPVEAIRKRFSPDMKSEWKIHAASGYPKIPYGSSLSRQPSHMPSQEQTAAHNLMRIVNFQNPK